MKYFSVFGIFVVLCKVEVFSQNAKSSSLQKAFTNIVEAIAQQNYLVSIVVSDTAEVDKAYSTIQDAFAGIPHVVARFGNEMRKFHLNSSAIVWLESSKALERFNKRTILPYTFSMS